MRNTKSPAKTPGQANGSLLFSPSVSVSVSVSIMAFRRALSLSSTLFSHHRHRLPTTTSSSYSLSSLLQTLSSSSQPPLQTPLKKPHSQTQTLLRIHHRGFHTTAFSFRQHQLNDNTNAKLDPDTILFEGCDYKHWLIVMDFPNDPQQRPPADQMIDTYVQTLAKVLGSVEEAKKKIYACSTTIYTGFQAEIDEETANKMEGLPGVLFVLPDSYIDPVNKEYGGDKYINGNIIPRPPPVQYGRVRRGRSTDQRPRGPMQNQEANPAYNQHPPDGRGYTPQQRFSQQPPPQGFSQQQDFPQQQSFSPQQGLTPQPGFPQQQGFCTQQGFPQPQGFSYQRSYPQQQRVPQPQQSYGPPGQAGRENSMPGGAHPAGGRDTYLGGGGNSFSYQGNHSHGYPRGQMDNHAVDTRNYTPHGNYNSAQPGRGAFGKTGIGSYDQSVAGQYGVLPTGTHGQGPGSGYGPGYRPHRENQGFVQTPDEHNNMSVEHRNHSPAGHTRTNHGY